MSEDELKMMRIAERLMYQLFEDYEDNEDDLYKVIEFF